MWFLRLLLLALVVGALGVVGPASGSEDATAPDAVAVGSACGERVAALVQARYDQIRDLEAEFEQTTYSVTLGTGSLGSSEPSRGRVIFAKPGKMRWSYEHPEPSLVVSDGVTLWLYNADLKEASRLRVTEGYLTGAVLQFLLGEGKLLEEFAVAASGCGGGEVELELVPVTPASYDRLGLVAVESTGEIVSTTIVDLFGNQTRISFEKLRTNLDPPAKTFVFDVPPDVEVIDVTAPQP
jgi:outer membrane lipoprotein carrier protein